jgi:hypothetical protein
MTDLLLKRAEEPHGEASEEVYDVFSDGEVVGRIMLGRKAPETTPWAWTLAYGHYENRTPPYGHEATRNAAMHAFAKVWRREA